MYSYYINEEDAESDIYSLFNKIMLNGHAEMFSNSKIVPKVLSNYKSISIEDVFYINKFKNFIKSIIII